MDFTVVVIMCLISSSTLVTAKNNRNKFLTSASEEDNEFHDEQDSLYEEEEDKIRLNDKELHLDDEEPSKTGENYEVTENVQDISDNTTVRGPIITNFTLGIPLNNASNANNNDTKAPNLKRNYISIFHVSAEYGNDKPDVTVIQNNGLFPNFNRYRNYIKGLREGIVNGLQNVVNNNQLAVSDANTANVHNIVNAPVVFFNRLQNVRADIAKKLQQSIFGRNQ